MTALKTQVISGNAPSATQIKGPLIQDWADQGVLVDIDKSATTRAGILLSTRLPARASLSAPGEDR